MKLPETWRALANEDAANLEAEVSRELAPTHLLHGRELVALARRVGRDDVVFGSPNGNGAVYVVHLTWRVETDPNWPSTEPYSNMDDFLDRWPREELGQDEEEAG